MSRGMSAGEYEYRIFNRPAKDVEQEPDEITYLGEQYNWGEHRNGLALNREPIFRLAVRIEVLWQQTPQSEGEAYPIALYTRKTINDTWQQEIY